MRSPSPASPWRRSVRVVPPEGGECAAFPAADYLEQVAEHVEPWSYVKFCYLKKVGWNGFTDGAGSGIYPVGPLPRPHRRGGAGPPPETPREGVGVVEAPRGTLIHHYRTDSRGIIEQANLIVATQNNSARMAMSVEKAAKGLLSKGHVSEGILNKIEMAFRRYDPCHACATHSLPGSMPLVVAVRGPAGETLSQPRRASVGRRR